MGSEEKTGRNKRKSVYIIENSKTQSTHFPKKMQVVSLFNKLVSPSDYSVAIFTALLNHKAHCSIGARLCWNFNWCFKMLFIECKRLVYRILENSNKCWWDGWEQECGENGGYIFGIKPVTVLISGLVRI